MVIMNKRRGIRSAAEAIIACLLIAGGSGVAYAADIGDIMTRKSILQTGFRMMCVM